MHVERDIAGITVPFIIGLAAAVCFGSCMTGYFIPVASISLLLCSIPALLLFSDITGTRRLVPRWPAVIAMMTFCGIFIGSSDLLLEVSRHDVPGVLGRAALDFGARLQKSIRLIPFTNPETNGIINALITGDKTGISHDIKVAFRESGASHVLALSGLHLGIIYVIIRKSLGIIGNSPAAKMMKSVTTMALCGFYTLATGAGPSIVRALLFIIIGETAMLTHRKNSLRSMILTAMFIQLIIEPSAIKDVGFQLSYAAVAGIAWIYPHLRSFWPGNPSDDKGMVKGLRWIWNSAALSIACQVTTGPLAYIYFQSFPMQFILTNLIAIPLTGLIIPSALLTLVASNLGCCPDILVRITEMLVTALSESLYIISTQG